MTDYKEEQSMELEALESIFLEDYELISVDPIGVSLRLEPFPGEEDKNYVGIKACFTFPETYPDVEPDISVESIKGLNDNQIVELVQLLKDEAQNNLEMPMVYTLAEVAKEWLEKNNKEEVEDSMYSKMIAKQEAIKEKEEEERAKAEAAKKKEIEEKQTDVKKYGHPCTVEGFNEWKEKFLAETTEEKEQVDENKVTGREFFANLKSSTRKELENAEAALVSGDWGTTGDADAGVQEDLFLEGDDPDLDQFDDFDELDNLSDD
uniref:RWD domain-containing protein n=1 Tax=Aplanochytrium stocchinoi TaxID=215587 RepID=A0A7S3LQI9_9STRA